MEGLETLNRMDAGSVLHPGSTVVVQSRGGPSQQRSAPLLHNAVVRRVQVQMGDTLAKVAERAGVSMMRLQQLNGLRTNDLREGDTLQWPAGVNDDARTGGADRRRRRRGLRGTRRHVTVRLFEAFHVRPPRRLLAGREKAATEGCVAERERARTNGVVQRVWGLLTAGLGGAHRATAPLHVGASRSRLRNPVRHESAFVSSGFGWRASGFHEGVDVAAEQGVPIRAAADGVVTYADTNGAYGKLLCLSHGHGFSTRYAHCEELQRRVGERVRAGEAVATVGATGRASGPHLHFEVRRNGAAQDPHDWLDLRAAA